MEAIIELAKKNQSVLSWIHPTTFVNTRRDVKSVRKPLTNLLHESHQNLYKMSFSSRTLIKNW